MKRTGRIPTAHSIRRKILAARRARAAALYLSGNERIAVTASDARSESK